MASGAPSTLIFDIHGVLIGRREPAGHRSPGAVVAALRRAGHPLRFLTNSSSVSRWMLVEQLAAAGVHAEAGEIFTAAGTVAHYLRSRAEPCRLFLIGSDGLRAEIEHSCGARVAWAAPEQADTVVISRDPSLDKKLLDRLAQASRPRLIATCRDRHFPNGVEVATGPGSTVRYVEQALGRNAWVIGKPNTYVLTEVMGLSAEQLANTIVIGDSLEQDVALCETIGARAVLVVNDPIPAGTESRGTSARHPHHPIRALDQLFSILEVAA